MGWEEAIRARPDRVVLLLQITGQQFYSFFMSARVPVCLDTSFVRPTQREKLASDPKVLEEQFDENQ